MKQLQTILNAAMGAAIVVLFYLVLSGGPSKTASAPDKSGDAAGEPRIPRLAYVDLDSIQVKYTYYKQKMDEFEGRKESADRELNNAFQKIENERVTFAQRGNAITQVEAENFQREYARKMQNLENQKRNLENGIQQEGVKTMEDLRKRINDFLVEYNKAKGYSLIFSTSSTINVLFHKDTALDITDDVVAGLNAAYAGNKTPNP
jgi:outer membrane protein